MCKIKFNIKMPIFVMRQFIRHRMQNVNEVSARYTELKDEFFVPEVFRIQAEKNKQSSELPTTKGSDWNAECQVGVQLTYDYCYKSYQGLLRRGVAREQARIVLPVGIYTEFYSCWDLNNLLKYFALRDDPHAQGEHQDYAKAMKEITRQCFPWVMDIYDQVASVPA
jgi:thymidylate synthase (FAD)